MSTNLGNAERNRPDQFGGPTAPVAQEHMDSSEFESAMDPSNVAGQVWDAIVNDQFYILPHPGFDQIVKDRVDRILSRSAPEPLDMADLSRRREAGELV